MYNQLQDHSPAQLPDTFRAERTGAIAATEKPCCHTLQEKNDTEQSQASTECQAITRHDDLPATTPPTPPYKHHAAQL